MLRGDRRALARLLSLLERDGGSLSAIMRSVYPVTGDAYCIGVTGPPGVGKSTIVDALVEIERANGTSVGILAVDPTSPFGSGAVLGDRIRMQRHYLDPAVFIRSLATRGAHGGLSRVVGASVKLLDAFGIDVIFVETVGAGQTEADIMRVADTVVVVLVPETGDAVQAMKAGLMEIADVFVINKADRPGAGRVAAAVRAMLRLDADEARWRQPVLLTRAHKGEGIRELRDAVQHHREAMESTSSLGRRRRERQMQEFTRTLTEALEAEVAGIMAKDGALGEIRARVESGELDPYSAADQALREGRLFARLGLKSGDRPPTAGTDG